MGLGMKSLKWEGFVTKNLFPHISTVHRLIFKNGTLCYFILPLLMARAGMGREGTCSPLKMLWSIFLANVNSSSCSLYVIGRPSIVCLSVCLSSVTLVHPTQAIEIIGNISTPCGTLAIRDLCIKILRRSSKGNPSVGGVKHKRGSRI